MGDADKMNEVARLSTSAQSMSAQLSTLTTLYNAFLTNVTTEKQKVVALTVQLALLPTAADQLANAARPTMTTDYLESPRRRSGGPGRFVVDDAGEAALMTPHAHDDDGHNHFDHLLRETN